MKVSIRHFKLAQPTVVCRRNWVLEFQGCLSLSRCFFTFDMQYETETRREGWWHCVSAAIVSPCRSDEIASGRWVTGRRESWGERTAIRMRRLLILCFQCSNFDEVSVDFNLGSFGKISDFVNIALAGGKDVHKKLILDLFDLGEGEEVDLPTTVFGLCWFNWHVC